jgi:hypothetical protein
MNKYFFFSFILSVGAIITSCDNKQDRDVKSAAISLVSNQSDIVAYGYVDVAAIVEKGELTSISTIGKTIESNFTKIASAFNTDEKMYYALSGPLDRDGIPSKVIGLAKVNNKDSLRNVFTDMGYMFEEEKNRLVYYDMSTAIGIDDNFVVFVTADFQGDPKEAMLDAFSNLNDKDQNERVAKILSKETDILISLHLENLYATSNTSLDELPEDQQDEIEEMVENSFVSTSINFKNGDLTIAMNTAEVSDAMKSLFFFKETGADEVARSIGPGKPMIGLAASLDIAKMEKFLNRFNPGAAKQFYRELGIGGFFLQAMGSEGIASLLKGTIGFNLFEMGEDAVFGGSIPVFNAYAGLGKNGEDITGLIHSYAEDGQIENLEDGFYRMNDAVLHASNDALILHSNDSVKERFSVEPITRLEGMEMFGEEPMFLFVNMEQVSSMELPISQEAQAIIDLTEYSTVIGNNEGITIKLIMKNKQENVLKQIVQKAADEFRSQLSNMSI